jgi:hypothetical protein
VFLARYANWHRDQVEGLVSVGSNPTRATDRNSSRRPAARTPVLHTGWRRFESCRDDSQPAGLQVFRQHTSLVGRGTEFDSRADLFSNGLLVQRDDTGFAHRRSGFDSPAVHCALAENERPMVQRDDVALAWWRSGFDSRWVHSNGR